MLRSRNCSVGSMKPSKSLEEKVDLISFSKIVLVAEVWMDWKVSRKCVRTQWALE